MSWVILFIISPVFLFFTSNQAKTLSQSRPIKINIKKLILDSQQTTRVLQENWDYSFDMPKKGCIVVIVGVGNSTKVRTSATTLIILRRLACAIFLIRIFYNNRQCLLLITKFITRCNNSLMKQLYYYTSFFFIVVVVLFKIIIFVFFFLINHHTCKN